MIFVAPPSIFSHHLFNNPDVNTSLSLAADMFLETSISGVSKKITSAIDESLSQ